MGLVSEDYMSPVSELQIDRIKHYLIGLDGTGVKGKRHT